MACASPRCPARINFCSVNCVALITCVAIWFPPSSFIRVITHEKVTKFLLVNGYRSSAHLWAFHQKENGNNRKKDHAQKLVIVEKSQHGRLALDHVEEHAVGLRGWAHSSWTSSSTG